MRYPMIGSFSSSEANKPDALPTEMENPMTSTRSDKAAATRFVNKIRTYMYPDGGYRSAPERDGVLHGKDVDLYHRKTVELRAQLASMSTEERERWMAQAFPLPKPYAELTEDDQAIARCWDWDSHPDGPFAEDGSTP